MRSRVVLLQLFLIFNIIIESKISKAQKPNIEKVILPNNKFSSKAHKVFTDEVGNLLFANENGVTKWNGNSFIEISKLKGFDEYSAFNIWQDNKGLIWINTFGENMLCYSNNKTIAKPYNSILNNYKINSSVQDIKGNYWFGDAKGRIIFIDTNGSVKINDIPSKEAIHRIHRIEPLKNGNTIAALVYGSFYLLNSDCEIIKKLDWKHDYNWGTGNMFCLNNGKVIFCNDKGIHLYSDKLILEKTILFDNEFNGYISDIKEDLDGKLYIGGKFGLFTLNPENFDRKNINHILKNNFVNSISIGIEDIIWVATHNGLLKIEKNIKKPYDRKDAEINLLQQINADTIKKYNVSRVLMDTVNATLWWAGNRNFGKKVDNIIKSYSYGKNVLFSPKSILLDKAGYLWIGGEGMKVFNIQTQKLQSLKELHKAKVLDCKLFNSNIIVATRNQGIFIINNLKIIANLNTENYLNSNNCSKIIPSLNGIYFKIENRIFKYEFAGNTIIKVAVINYNFNSLDIINISESMNEFTCYTKDSVWNVPKKNFKYPIEINLFSNGISLESYKLNKINYHSYETVISFSCATFQNQDLLCFRYKILKNENSSNWFVTPQKSVNLFGLEPGTYSFILEYSFDKYNWTVSKPINFEIIPPFWKTAWFKVLMVFCFITVICILFLERFKVEKNKRITTEIKLKALQSQMNPHFIFNSLNAIQQFIFSNDVVKSNHYLSRFASLMRKCYEYANLDEISIKDEITFLENYLEIETLRFDMKFKSEIEVAPAISLENKIPPLLIQPIVENAIKHGFKKLKEGGIILIKFSIINALLEVTISDNGTGFDGSKNDNKTGSLQRLKERFLLMKKASNNKLIALSHQSVLGKGTTVYLTIPLIK